MFFRIARKALSKTKTILYIGQFLPDTNNVYEESLLSELGKQTDYLEVISICKSSKHKNLDFLGHTVNVLSAFKRPVIDEVYRFFELLVFCLKWCKKHRGEDIRIILQSASIEVSLVALFLEKIKRIKCINLIIDTALGNIKKDSLWNRYLYVCYFLSEKLSKFMSGSMALNNRVFDHLNLLQKPCHITKIGHRLTEYSFKRKRYENSQKKIVYTGSFMYYDGTEELLDAFELLKDSGYSLHFYGRGPLESLIKERMASNKNIFLHGYLNNNEMKKVMEDAALLVNPRISYKHTDIFGFPSKMIEYLLSGTPVLTTHFAAMPEEYKRFTYPIEEESAKGIAVAIASFSKEDVKNIHDKTEKAYQYIFENNGYSRIVNEMVEFVFNV